MILTAPTRGTTTCSCSRRPTTCCSCTQSRRRMVVRAPTPLNIMLSVLCSSLAGGTVPSSLGVVDFLNNYQHLLRTNCDMFASNKRLTAHGERLHKCAVWRQGPPPNSAIAAHPLVQMPCTCTTGWSATFWSGVMQNCRLN